MVGGSGKLGGDGMSPSPGMEILQFVSPRASGTIRQIICLIVLRDMQFPDCMSRENCFCAA